ncbi:MAG: PEP-CTERM sorting domain-containing protein [Fimbriimonadaceae bacterium]
MKLGLGIVLFSLAGAANAQFFFDDFNRADSADLGPNYTHVAGTSATRVISNRAGNVAGNINLSLVNAGNFSANYALTIVEADIFHDGVAATGYVSLSMGHNGVAAGGNGLYIKLQTQSGATMFNTMGFYTGNGSGTTTFWTDPPVFFTLATPFQNAHMTLWASDAATINVGLDTDFDGNDDQVHTRHLNLGAMTFGTQVGLSVFGTNTTIDNFQASVVPEPASMAALGLGALALVRRRRNKN